MRRIVRIGMDVHSEQFTLCALEMILGQEDVLLAHAQCPSSAESVADFIKVLCGQQKLKQSDLICGYEAGCLGYSLYRQLKARGIACVILAPTTMLSPLGKRVKTDRRDAYLIAQSLLHGGYHAVYVPTEADCDVKDYLRMREDHKIALKKIKQQVNSYCLHLGLPYTEGSKWTKKHWDYLHHLELSTLQRETLDEYLETFAYLSNRIEQLDQRIEEIATSEQYREDVKKLECFLGIKTYTALSICVEVSDFNRFPTAQHFSSFLGLTPGEASSGDTVRRLSITKAGNQHLRTLLIEAAQCFSRGHVGYKSKTLKARQEGNSSRVITYADKANTRLRKRFYRLFYQGKNRNIAMTAIARELACFIWGMMTDRMDPVMV